MEAKNIFASSHSEHHCWICPYKEAPKIVALLHVAGAPHFSPLSHPLSLSLSLYVSHERGVLTERQTANIAIATHQHMCNACGFCLFWPIQNLLPFWRPAGWLTYLVFVIVCSSSRYLKLSQTLSKLLCLHVHSFFFVFFLSLVFPSRLSQYCKTMCETKRTPCFLIIEVVVSKAKQTSLSLSLSHLRHHHLGQWGCYYGWININR